MSEQDNSPKPDAEPIEVSTDSDSESVDQIDPISELKEMNSKLKNEYLYLRAEFDNFRKNSIKERSELIKYGPERLASGLIDVLDIFEKALEGKVNADNIDSFIEGIHMTSRELSSTLERFGVKSVDSLGKAFDPNLHEALGSEVHSEIAAGHITQVFKKPYMFHDKILRHGQVIICKAEEKNKDNTQPSKDDDEILSFE